MNKILRTTKALQQLGWDQLWPFLRYQFRLRSGILRRQTPIGIYAEAAQEAGKPYLPLFPLPNLGYLRAVLGEDTPSLLTAAREVTEGQVRLFGGAFQPLELTPTGKLDHWTRHTGAQHHGEDIKLIWEPARFGWATTLGRAYLVDKDNLFAEAFWSLVETFAQGNPPNTGPHWASGQEVALRLIALAFSAGLMAEAPATTRERQFLLAGMLAAHAERILPTLDYARSQNNNHLISEAVGLYTAAVALPEHPQARKWKEQGWRWLHHALQTQIDEDGTYSQHSTNYHRLMLQLALFARRLAEEKMESFPPRSLSKLAAATRWLLALLDKPSGGVPNLGGNDGAYILPLTTCPYADFRPVAQASAQAFLNETPLPPGPGDEMTLWLGGRPVEETPVVPNPSILRLSGLHSWAYLRAVHFSGRPAHADQLHLDLWWRGSNITMDPGVYQYNADAPWDNPLDVTAVHSTLTVDGQPQMTKAGRFLWLDWAQAEVLDTSRDELDRLTWAVARHDGYRRLGISHRRMVSVEGNTWLVRDQLLPTNEKKKDARPHHIRLHWMLPDWQWQFNNGILRLDSGKGDVVVQVRSGDAPLNFSLVRAGQALVGANTNPVRGWFSPTYAVKVPALSLAVVIEASLPVTFTTRIELPD